MIEIHIINIKLLINDYKINNCLIVIDDIYNIIYDVTVIKYLSLYIQEELYNGGNKQTIKAVC